MCEDNDIGFICKDLVREHIATDKIHLSESGLNEISNVIFRDCREFFTLDWTAPLLEGGNHNISIILDNQLVSKNYKICR